LRAVLNDGPAGIGKSRSTIELAKMFPRIDVRSLSGQISPLAMYRLLHECRTRNSILIVDESFVMLADNQIQHMLRCALYSGVVDWRSHGQTFKSLKLPESFSFRGRVIFNTNVSNHTDANHKAMLDRVFYNRLVLTGEQIALKMIRKREYSPRRDVWRFLEEHLLQIRSGATKTRLSKKEREDILHFTVHRVLQISRTYNTELSVRILERVERLCLFLKQLFGELDFEFAKGLAKHYFVVDDEEDFIRKVIAENGGTVAAKDLAAILRDTQQYSLRTAQRRIEEYVTLGRILAPKRGLLALPAQDKRPAPATPAPPTPGRPASGVPTTRSAGASQGAWGGFCSGARQEVSPASPK